MLTSRSRGWLGARPRPAGGKAPKRSGKWRNVVNPTPAGGSSHASPTAALLRPTPDRGRIRRRKLRPVRLVRAPEATAGRFRNPRWPQSCPAEARSLFTELNAGPGSPYAFLGNEPTLQTPWIYSWLSRPDKAQSIVRRAQIGLYRAGRRPARQRRRGR